MDTVQRLERLHEDQCNKILPTLRTYFEQDDETRPRLDPRSRRSEKSKKLSTIIPFLLKSFDETPNGWRQLFASQQVVNLYSELLIELLRSTFQSCVASSIGLTSDIQFLRCTLKTYEYLYTACKAMDSKSLRGTIELSQLHFMKSWNKLQNESLLFDQVRDLLSHSHDYVAPPLFDMRKVLRREHFRLTCKKFKYENLYVELFHLSDGRMAVFKVNPQVLPLTSAQHTHDLILRLTRNLDLGAYHDSLFQTGRTLLFPTIRPLDLEIIDDAKASMTLGTKTGNNVNLVLSPVDAATFTSYWRPYLRGLCNPQGQQSTALNEPECADEGLTISRGLGISLKKSVARNVINTKLHRSNPLSPELLSFSQMDKMDINNLLELNKNTDASNPNSTVNSPLIATVHSAVAPVRTIHCVSPIIGTQVDDTDSIISDYNCNESDTEEQSKNSPVFTISAEFHRPQLTKRKSSSLLSLFKKNKSKVKQDGSVSSTNVSKTSISSSIKSKEVSTTSTASSAAFTPKSSTTSLPSTTGHDECVLPAHIKIDLNCVVLDTLIKLSCWQKNTWRSISPTWLQLQVVRSNQDKYLFMVQDENSKLKVAITISERWVISRTTAQDLQVRFSPSEVLCSIIEPTTNLITIRCPQVENVKNVLQHCRKNEIFLAMNEKLSNSSTQVTLESNCSSISSNNLFDKPSSGATTATSTLAQSLSKTTISNPSTNYKSLLLLSKIKVRLHKYDAQFGWKMKQVGLVSIYSRECNGSVVGCKFEMDDSLTFTCTIPELQRIGRTGISTKENLLEFKSPVTADETFKLLSSL